MMAFMSEHANTIDRTASLILFDLYGALLTDRTRDVLDLYLSEDLSLAEIAENLHISRQGVHDTITRGLASLQEYETRLELMKRRSTTRQAIDKALQAASDGDLTTITEQLGRLAELL